MNKQEKRVRRKKRIRRKLKGSSKRPRLSIFRSNKNIYVQLIDDISGTTLIGLSGKKITESKKSTKLQTAVLLGEELAKKAKARKIKEIVFDRSGYKYHGRVKAIAESARKGGLKF